MKDLKLIVSDTGPLISLEVLRNGYQFIRLLYDQIVVPPAVLEELAQGQFNDVQTYLHHYDITNLIEVRYPSSLLVLPETTTLHQGETQAIQLALEFKTALLIEETAGRQVASRLGIEISGIAGQILKAFRNHLIDAVEAKKKLGELFQGGRINRRIYEALVSSIVVL